MKDSHSLSIASRVDIDIMLSLFITEVAEHYHITDLVQIWIILLIRKYQQ